MPVPMLKSVRRFLGQAKHNVRQWRAVHLPDGDQRAYERWARLESARRLQAYPRDPEPGLFSILTAAWDGSPAAYLRELAASIADQNNSGHCEWVIVDNGCRAAGIRDELTRLSAFGWVRLVRLERNAGIAGGLRSGLEAARGRYTMSVDADDLLYPDALRTASYYVEQNGLPALLYSDEDKTSGGRRFEAYLKPDWDPALMLDSAYIAHLGIVDRRKALELGAYTDPNTEGSADWDLFVRFVTAGETPVHIPEVLYSWRVHAGSTAGNAGNKSYIHSSQRAVLQRFVDAQASPSGYAVTESPLLPGLPHFRIVKASSGTHAVVTGHIADPCAPASTLLDSATEAERQDEWLVLQQTGLRIAHDDWLAEAETLFELLPDAVMLTGLVVNQRHRVQESGGVFGFAGVCGDPYRGRVNNPGYFGELWKRRCVSAGSVRFAIFKPTFLLEVLRGVPEGATVGFLGAWAGAHAMRSGKRIVYSPFLGGMSQSIWHDCGEREKRLFAEINRDLIPDARFYSRHFSRTRPFVIGR